MIKKFKAYLENLILEIIQKNKVGPFDDLRGLPNIFINPQNSINESSIVNISHKAIYVSFGVNVGCRKFCNFMVYPNASLIIGDGVYFNNYCSVNCLGTIEIGSDTLIGENVKIYDHNHKYDYEKSGVLTVSKAEFTIGEVRIGKNCWIGSNVTILNNVVIGDNVIIGANCLIYKSVPANTIVKCQTNLIMDQYDG